MESTIRNILEIAVNAPSGHNCQPWKFVIKGGLIFIYNNPNKDQTLFNHKQKGSFTAHGALIENIVIASSEAGLSADVILFPEGNNNQDLVARINLTKSNERYEYDYFYPFITKRTTNRRMYKTISLENTHKEEIEKFISDSTMRGTVLLAEDMSSVSSLAKLFSVGDRVLFDNRYLHRALFSVVNWNLDEEQQRREGLFVGTKELSLPIRLIFRYFISNWRLLSHLSFLELPVKMAHKRESLYNHSSTIGIITSRNDSPAEFVESGRILQRLWLKITSMELSFQPVSVGLLYLGQWTQVEKPSQLNQKQYEYVSGAYSSLIKIFNLHDRVPSFSFRIGYSGPPTASSLKKPPLIISM